MLKNANVLKMDCQIIENGCDLFEGENLQLTLTYECVTTEKFIEDYGNAAVYGVKITQKNNITEKQEILFIEDISCDYEKVKLLINMMHLHKVTIMSAMNVVEDYLT